METNAIGCYYFKNAYVKPVLAAQGICKATLMDELALGSWLDDWSSCYKPHYPTGGQWLAYRGRGMVKTTFLPLPFILKERSWVQTQRPSKKFWYTFVSKRQMFYAHNNFPNKSSSCALFALKHNWKLLSFLPSPAFFINLMVKNTISHQVFWSFFTIQYTGL